MITGWLVEAPDLPSGMLAAIVAAKVGNRVERIEYQRVPARATRYTWDSEHGARLRAEGE